MSRYYTISEFAKLICVSSCTLRNWDKKGILKPHHRTPSGYRYYSDEQLTSVINNTENFVEIASE